MRCRHIRALRQRGEVKDLLFRTDDSLDFRAFSFKARCKWSEIQAPTWRCFSGFEIADIWENSSRNLRDFMQLATVTFEDPSKAAG